MSALLNDHRLWISAGGLLVVVLVAVARRSTKRPAPIQIGERGR